MVRVAWEILFIVIMFSLSRLREREEKIQRIFGGRGLRKFLR